MSDREKHLGFLPQKELLYNKLLPYADKLDEVSKNYLIDIKTNLGKAILNREIESTAIAWCSHLSKYIQLYGQKFSKADHVHFIHLLLDLLVLPELEFHSVEIIASVLVSLLRKTELLSRDDLVIQWRPLYDLYKRSLLSSNEQFGLLLLPGNFECTLKKLTRLCRIYFPVESTKEMLEEWRPLMCLYDVTMIEAITYFDLFFCTKLPPHQHDQGFKLWFPDLIKFWSTCQNNPHWEESIVWLFARLANDTIGYIDWEPYMPQIFTRLFQTLKLPTETHFNMTKVQLQTTMQYPETSAYILWIISMLGGGSSCQMHIGRFFKALESYYHPSNHGRWVLKLQQLLHKLPFTFVNRLRRERYKKNYWEPLIPEKNRLTDADVTNFVQSLQPVTLIAMFSKVGSIDCAAALQNLAILRPEIIIPPIIEQWNSSLENLTEPHRLIASINCVVALARSIVRKNKYFPEGPTHVIPLLMGMLPGIDPNDIKKCVCSLNFIATFARVVLFVDCSSSVQSNPNLSQIQQELCSATAAFEEFVLQYMDRCFALIESSSFHHPTRLDQDTEKMSLEENITEFGITTTFHNLLEHCSPSIYMSALNNLFTFVSTHILETKVSGKYAAHMCQCAAKVNPNIALELFVPHFTKIILALTDNEEIANEEKLDDELLFSLLVLAEVFGFDGNQVVKYQDSVIKVLNRTLHLKCKDGYKLACDLMFTTIGSMTLTYTCDFGLIPNFWKACNSDDELHTLIDTWGMPGNIKDLRIEYHHPSDAEMDLAQKFLELFLLPELDRLKQWANEKSSMSRDEILCSLNIVMYFLLGASTSLPIWDQEPLNISDSSIPVHTIHTCSVNCKALNASEGKNVRLLIIEVLQEVLNTMLKSSEDDTKSLFTIIRIFQYALFDWGVKKEEFDVKWKSYCVRKKSLENKLSSTKEYTRSLLIYRMCLHNEMHLLERHKFLFTRVHASVMKDLFRLAVSHYAQVRSRAQMVLRSLLCNHVCSYKVILPDLIEILRKDPTLFHEEFKGALYVVMGMKQTNLLTIRHWQLTSQIWPAIINVKHSEKPSIINLLEVMPNTIQQFWETFQLQLEVPQNVLEKAKLLWSSSDPLPIDLLPTEADIQKAGSLLVQRNNTRKMLYYGLVNDIVNSIQNGNLHWRQYRIAFKMLQFLIRYDINLPAPAVKLFVEHLICDTLAIRKVAIAAVGSILKQQKRKHPLMEVDPCQNNDFPLHPVLEDVLQNRKRPSTLWLQYNSVEAPDTQEKWNKRIFVHRTHIGYTSFAKPFNVYSPESEQPKLNRTQEELREEEVPFYDSFSQPVFVEKLVNFFSLEEKKGSDKFSTKRFLMFKGLFRNFGDTFLPQFRDHIKSLTEDQHESKQRCAAEILTGLLRGSKHWGFEKIHNMKEFLIPVFKTVLKNITTETLKDWVTCLGTASESRDPNHYYWLFELLMEKQLDKDESGSFLESSWLYLLCNFLSQQEWRVMELLHRTYAQVRPKLSHPYPNVREKMGGLLAMIFLYDSPLAPDFVDITPKRADFLNLVLPKLALLENNGIDPTASLQEDKAEDVNMEVVQNHSLEHESIEKKETRKLLQTVCRFLVTSIIKNNCITPPDFYQLLPVLCSVCSLQNEMSDNGFHRDCLFAVTMLGQSLLDYDGMEAALSTVKKIASFESTQSRAASITFLQLIVFTNLFTIMHHDEWLRDIKNILLQHLHDKRVEVREAASGALGGLLHCEVLKVNDELISTFKQKCRKVKKKANPKNADGRNKILILEPEELYERHAGILGLCACIKAFPYDVPAFMPDVLVFLGDHLHDPQPIQTTVKKTLSDFRRTHHDSWRDHKLKFTEDQLAVVTDLLVSPSYYA